MKKTIISAYIISLGMLVACSKQRTCSCTNKTTTVTVTTPRSSGSATTTTSTNDATSSDTYEKISKKDLARFGGCLSSESSSTDTYTTIVSTPTITSVGGFTFNSTTNQTADVSRTVKDESTCEIK